MDDRTSSRGMHLDIEVVTAQGLHRNRHAAQCRASSVSIGRQDAKSLLTTCKNLQHKDFTNSYRVALYSWQLPLLNLIDKLPVVHEHMERGFPLLQPYKITLQTRDVESSFGTF